MTDPGSDDVAVIVYREEDDAWAADVLATALTEDLARLLEALSQQPSSRATFARAVASRRDHRLPHGVRASDAGGAGGSGRSRRTAFGGARRGGHPRSGRRADSTRSQPAGVRRRPHRACRNRRNPGGGARSRLL